jgi:pimeloyl-ACP methyl ester carboxylesterase
VIRQETSSRTAVAAPVRSRPRWRHRPDPPAGFRLADHADRLAAFIAALGLGSPQVAGVSFGGGLALELFARHPTVPASLVLASAYAGWAGSLPAEEVDRRLQQVLSMADLPPERFAAAVAPTMFSAAAAGTLVDAFVRSVSAFHPAGLRAMALAIAEADLREVVPRIDVPTLLIHGGEDTRAPLTVAEELHAGIPGSRLVVLSGAGHVCCAEAAERFNAELRAFLRHVA